MVPAEDMTESDEPLTAVESAVAGVTTRRCVLTFRTAAERDLFMDKITRALDTEGLAYIDVL